MRNSPIIKPCQGLACLLAAGFLLLSGCILAPAPVRTGGTVSVVSPDFFGISEDIAIQLSGNLRRPLANSRRLIMTTVVDIDNLYQTSRFGRTLAEALSTRLFKHGFGIIEIRKSTGLLMKNNAGELILSRDASLVAQENQAEAIITGTYSLTPNSVIVNIKIIDAGSQEVLSVAGSEIQRSHNINVLLAGSAGMADAELSAYEH